MKRIITITLVAAAMMFVSGVASADEMEQLRRENAELRQRLERLEDAMYDVKSMITEQPEVIAETEGETFGIRSKYDVELYGFIKLDAAYDDSRTSVGNFARWAESESTNDDDDEFNMTANQTRLGLKFRGPDTGEIKTSGKVEVDFYGGGSENKAHPFMRHAYLQLDWPNKDLSLIAGQTWDVISPLNPSTLNYPVAWWAGNIGYRRPQIRLTKQCDVGQDSRMLLAGAVTRTIGEDGPFDPGDTGEDAGFPTLQGRAALTFPALAGKKATVGVSGHWGEEEYDTDAADHGEDLETWSANVDLALPINDWLMFKGEAWTGENLDAFLGGIGQGVNTTTLEEIESTGGWAALAFGPFDKWRYNVGASIDDPDNGDLNDGDRSQNYAVWGNAIYSITEAVKVGLELSYWDTEYKNADDGDDVRVQTSFIYNF